MAGRLNKTKTCKRNKFWVACYGSKLMSTLQGCNALNPLQVSESVRNYRVVPTNPHVSAITIAKLLANAHEAPTVFHVGSEIVDPCWPTPSKIGPHCNFSFYFKSSRPSDVSLDCWLNAREAPAVFHAGSKIVGRWVPNIVEGR